MTLAEDIRITTEEQGDNLLVAPEGPLTIYEAGSLHETFLSGFQNHKGMILDLRAVTDCDTAGVQLLCSARKTADQTGKKFSVDGIGPAVLKALDSCGLTPEKVFDPREEV